MKADSGAAIATAGLQLTSKSGNSQKSKEASRDVIKFALVFPL
jgi:hypothetical protein